METTTTYPGRDGHVGDPVRLGIVTVSDRASRGEYVDEGGPAILAFFQDAIKSPLTAIYRCVPDERDAVEAALIELADEEQCSVVVTTGGTGPAPRDITPEATEAVCDRMMPGFGEQMRAISLSTCPPPSSRGRSEDCADKASSSTSLVVRNPFERPSMSCGKPFHIALI